MKDLNKIWRIYEEAFPPEERRDREAQEKVMKENNYFVKTLQEEEKTVGFIAYWDLQEFIFVEHMAVDHAHRGRGFGGKLLGELVKETEGLILLEVEPPVEEVAKKRVKFYQNLGFQINDIDYLQPSYGAGKEPVHLLLMSYPSRIPKAKEQEMISSIHRVVYGKS